MPLAIFGINNTALSLAVTFAILSLVAIWIALIVFTFIDARRRISDPFLVGCATAASLFPFVGTIVYTILRPAEFLDDVRERETEMKSAETELRHLEANSCHKCGFPTHPDYVRCPGCRSRLKEPCPSCDRPVGLKWKVCPYCEHTLIASKRSKTASRSSSSRSSDSRSSDKARSAKASRTERSSRTDSERPGRSEAPRSERPSREGSGRGERATRSERPSAERSSAGSPSPASSSSGSSPEEAPRRSRRSRRDSASDTVEAAGSAPEQSSSRGSRRRIVVDDETEVSHRPINSGDSAPAPEPERG
jgi:predicted Zn-ribbon and HTH transcriptional regulator